MTGRNIDGEGRHSQSLAGMAEIANNYAMNGMDLYSDYGVGACLLVETAPEWTWNGKMYAAFNINLPGMQTKVHAEQLCLHQFLMDALMSGETFDGDHNVNIRKIVVVTSEEDHSLVCGHCLQVLRGVCDYIDQDPWDVGYISAVPKVDGKYDYEKFTLEELLGCTYVENRGVNDGPDSP